MTSLHGKGVRATSFLCSPKGEHIVAALSVHPSHFCAEHISKLGELIVAVLSVCPSHFCPEHISKNDEDNLMKLDKLIEDHEGNCRMQET